MTKKMTKKLKRQRDTRQRSISITILKNVHDLDLFSLHTDAINIPAWNVMKGFFFQRKVSFNKVW